MRVVGLDELRDGFAALGVRRGGTLVVHASLSAFGTVDGGADTVLRALVECVGDAGTVVVPTFTPEVSDPSPLVTGVPSREVADARAAVPLYDDAMPTTMGAVPNALLRHPGRMRSSHPQASVAALGARAEWITRHQPLAYATGQGSPFHRLYEAEAQILLLGVGHDRNSFLHYAESLVPTHRRKLRRFPYVVEGQRVWVEADDVGDDNGTYFPLVGAEFAATGGEHVRTIGAARCRLLHSNPFIDHATRRLPELLATSR